MQAALTPFRLVRFSIAALLLGGLVCPAHAAEWQVQPGESIQAAIAHAAPGDTIRVARGRYPENLRIDKPVKLIGVDRHHTVKHAGMRIGVELNQDFLHGT